MALGHAGAQEGSDDHRRAPERVRHASLRQGARHLGPLAEAAGLHEGADAARVRLALDAAQDHEAGARHRGHGFHEHVDALPGIELARIEHARGILVGEPGKGSPGRHVAAVGDDAHAAPRPVTLGERVADAGGGRHEAGGPLPDPLLAPRDARRLAGVGRLGRAVERSPLEVHRRLDRMSLVDDPSAPRGGKAEQQVGELEVAGEDGGAAPPRGEAGRRRPRQEGGPREDEASPAVQDAQPPHLEARVRLDAEERQHLGRGPRVAPAHHQADAASRAGEGGRGLHDLHAVRALERKTDVREDHDLARLAHRSGLTASPARTGCGRSSRPAPTVSPPCAGAAGPGARGGRSRSRGGPRGGGGTPSRGSTTRGAAP